MTRPSFLRAHRRQHGKGGVERAVEVDADHFLPALDGLVLPVAVGHVQARAVDENVHAGVTAEDGGCHFLHRLRVRYVQRLDFGLAALDADFLRLQRQHFLAPPRHHHRRTRIRQRLGAGQADPRSRARDPGHFPRKRNHCSSRYFANAESFFSAARVAANASRSACADSVTARFAASTAPPIRIKPWIMPS